MLAAQLHGHLLADCFISRLCALCDIHGPQRMYLNNFSDTSLLVRPAGHMFGKTFLGSQMNLTDFVIPSLFL